VRGRRSRFAVIAIATALGLAVAAPAAEAAITSVFDGRVACAPQDGIRFCGGDQTVVPTWDGIPIDVNVALPPEPATGPDGPYPLIGIFHGWGGEKIGIGTMRPLAEDGYAAFSMTARGFGDSCGGGPAPVGGFDCTNGYIRLMDTRYEVRDAQELIGRLVDEGVANPAALGATGGSYGGGMSMALAALRNRQMLPDGSLVPWTSPDGTPLRIAAAAPDIPWTDLAYSLVPNGHTLDYVIDAPYLARGRIGISKSSYIAGLYAAGDATGYYAPPGTNPDADLTSWFALINAGEPYDDNPAAADIVDEITSHHSSYYVDHSVRPAPLFISNGWTDDLFPVDEALRFYNRTRVQWPGARMSLFFSDHGHMRGQNKGPDVALRQARVRAWFDYYLKHEGAEPFRGVEVLTQTCGTGAPSAGPYTAKKWPKIARGEVRLNGAASQTVSPGATDSVGPSFDPIGGGGACAATASGDQAGTANYRLGPIATGFTLLGSPTIVADIASPSSTSQLAARLLDVGPGGQQTLVARGTYRPEIGINPTRQVFQLHPNAWRFEPGHVAKLELLPADAPAHRASNGQGPVTVSNLELRLPTRELPGTGLSQLPAPKVVPPGYQLAPGYPG
jgi:predicted acyl esterase